MASQQSTPETRMVRPGHGNLGTQIQVTVNAYKVTLPTRVVYHYDLAAQGVVVGPKGPTGDIPPRLGRDIFIALRDKARAFDGVSVVYDGRKNLFSPTQLKYPDGQKSFEVEVAGDQIKAGVASVKKFRVTITKVNEIKLESLINYVQKKLGPVADEGVEVAITALNILCNHDVSMAHLSSKNKYFPAPPPGNERLSLKIRHGVEMWRGYFGSVRMAPGGMILNFDIASQPMITPGNLIDVALSVIGANSMNALSDLRGPAKINLIRALRSVTVTVNRCDGTKLRCKIKEVAGTARTYKFEAPVSANSDQMRTWTVLEYFARIYHYKIKRPDLPLVRLTAKAWYPMELCDVNPNQKFMKKLSPEQLSDAIRWLTVKPEDRTRMLTDGITQHLAKSPSLSQWGVKFDPRPMTIAVRRLPPPTIHHTSGSKKIATKVDNGSWNMANKGFYKAASIKSWIAIAFLDQRDRFTPALARNALADLEKAMRLAGMQVAGLQGETVCAQLQENISDAAFNKWITSNIKSKPDLIVCFLSNKNAWQYRRLKMFGDSVHNLATQCLSTSKLNAKTGPQYYANVALKINAKLGGVNHAISRNNAPLFPARDTMLMGADVTHPGMGSEEPSIAALVGSTNEHGTGYSAEFSVQEARKEIIVDLDSMAMSLIKKYFNVHSQLPSKLVFYRDGVSEGQFAQVLQEEVPLLRKAIRSISQIAGLREAAERMKITFIVCGKRHHFRFGPANRNDSDKGGNLLPGVVVDTTVTHPFDFDWYGLSHAGLLGTSRASHYTVLVDDSRHEPDEIQSLTYQICYLYSRSTRSVSIATPAYYAHHVCTRIKQLLTVSDSGGSIATSNSAEARRMLEIYGDRALGLRQSFQRNYEGAKFKPVQKTRNLFEYWM